MTPPSRTSLEHFSDVFPCRPAATIVAIPACNEAERIGACLAALAVQRDAFGAPLASGTFEILIFANNCSDGTAAAAETVALDSPHPVLVVSEALPPERSNAGWARKRAMDLAADRLTKAGHRDGLILTTDADSLVGPTWLDATLRAIAAGADCVAGYVDAHPAEMIGLGRAFLQRGRLEDRYLRAVAEIYAVCDPRPHDPWPNHRVSSGASLAVRLAAYRSIGGLPPKPVGEDAALTVALEAAGFRVRHAMDVCVWTSCRFDGRARGGAADTMRYRHEVLDAPCDDDLEPALPLVRRALCKGRLRRLHERGRLRGGAWGARFGLGEESAAALASGVTDDGFEGLWGRVVAASPTLSRRTTLRPSDLARQIERASMVLAVLRAGFRSPTVDPVDSRDHARSLEPVAA